jgi:hypothetical protein
MPGLCDPETEPPLSEWRVTLVVAPISLPPIPAKACLPGGRAGHPRSFGCRATSVAQRGWSARTPVRCVPRSGCELLAERVVASAGPQLRTGCAAAKARETPTWILDKRPEPAWTSSSPGLGRAESAPSDLRCRACWLVGFGPAAPVLARRLGVDRRRGVGVERGFPARPMLRRWAPPSGSPWWPNRPPIRFRVWFYLVRKPKGGSGGRRWQHRVPQRTRQWSKALRSGWFLDLRRGNAAGRRGRLTARGQGPR